MKHFKMSNGILILQILATLLILVLTRDTKDQFSMFDVKQMWKWKIVAVAFGLPLLTNMRALAYLNVETAIVFRSLSILIVALTDFLVMKESFSTESIFGMLLIFFGSLLYGYYDIFFDPHGYFWGMAYCLSLVFNGVYIKYMFNQSGKMSSSEKTYLNNIVTLPIFFTLMVMEEPVWTWVDAIQGAPATAVAALIGSCFLGTSISYTGTVLRSIISATAFNIAGNSNKFITVLISMTLVEQNFGRHTPISLVGLCMALFGAGWYALASTRKPAAQPAVASPPKSPKEGKSKSGNQ